MQDKTLTMMNPRYVDDEIQQQENCVKLLLEHQPHLTLYEAIQPIIPLIPSIPLHVQKSLDWVEDNASAIINKTGLSKHQAASINLYTRDCLYLQVNQALRSSKRQNLEPYRKYIGLLLGALQKLPPCGKSIIYRAISGEPTYVVEKKYCWWGFSSCTTDMNVLKGFMKNDPVVLLIHTDSSFGVDISCLSVLPKEKEILLSPGFEFISTGKGKIGNVTCIEIQHSSNKNNNTENQVIELCSSDYKDILKNLFSEEKGKLYRDSLENIRQEKPIINKREFDQCLGDIIPAGARNLIWEQVTLKQQRQRIQRGESLKGQLSLGLMKSNEWVRRDLQVQRRRFSVNFLICNMTNAKFNMLSVTHQTNDDNWGKENSVTVWNLLPSSYVDHRFSFDIKAPSLVSNIVLQFVPVVGQVVSSVRGWGKDYWNVKLQVEGKSLTTDTSIDAWFVDIDEEDAVENAWMRIKQNDNGSYWVEISRYSKCSSREFYINLSKNT